MRYLLFCILFLVQLPVIAQTVAIKGKVLSTSGVPLNKASIHISPNDLHLETDDKGEFVTNLYPSMTYQFTISYVGYETKELPIQIKKDPPHLYHFYLKEQTEVLETAVVKTISTRNETGAISVNTEQVRLNPSPVGGIEGLIKIFVGSNNELSSQYTVRGGNYDENLIYVNDFEIYRPYLVRSGQQEGLSFIHPEMVNDVKFYNGGFSAKYSDKMSSVLDVHYKKPTSFGGTAYLSLLEQGIHIENISTNKKLTYNIGARNRTNQNLLKSQETVGNYIPTTRDIQAYLTYQLNAQHQIDFLGNYSVTQFNFIPKFAQLTSNVFSPYGISNIGVNIFFEGREKDRYSTMMGGLSWKYQPHSNLQLKWLMSYFENDETEHYDILGNYTIGERSLQNGGMIDQPIGAGMYHEYARNSLNVHVLNLSHKGSLKHQSHFLEWGLGYDRQKMNDRLYEWDYIDSAGHILPIQEGIQMNHFIQSNQLIEINRFNGFIMDKWVVGKEQAWILQPGIRTQYNDLNQEWLVSPRVNISYKRPNAEKDIVWRMSAGLYHQPPFYREMRRRDGSLNTDLKAQKSWQVSGGFDHQFHVNNSPFRWTTEIYYKNIWDQVSYEINNVRIRYSGENDSKAYAVGVETRLFGELVKGAESWISLGIMSTKEKLENDEYKNFIVNDQNEVIDSLSMNRGWMRRPTDRLFTLGLFIQDYLAKNQNNKVYLNILYGSNLPYSIPNSIKYRNELKIDPYIRVDIGFSTLLYSSNNPNNKRYLPFRQFKDIWASVEIFNLIDRDNVIAYQFIKDYQQSSYALPNRLTPRLINFKLIAKF